MNIFDKLETIYEYIRQAEDKIYIYILHIFDKLNTINEHIWQAADNKRI